MEVRTTSEVKSRLTRTRVIFSALLSSGAFLLPVGTASAQAPISQETEEGSATTEAPSSDMKEIVVTARKRVERIQDVPVSIAVVGSEELTRRGADRLDDLGRTVANLVIPQSSTSSRPAISIRGINSNVRNLGFEDGVGVYLDGVAIGRREGFNLDLGDVERVELLRGPQGTLFGKNTIAGALSITTKSPTDELAVEARGNYGRFDYATLRAMINLPIVEDTAALRLNFSRVRRDGTVTNVFNGEKLDSLNNYSGRAKLRVTPSDNVEIILAGDALWDSHTLASSEVVRGFGFVPGKNTVSYNFPDNFEKRNIYGGSLTVNVENSGFDFTSITAYRRAKARLKFDQDNSALDLFSIDFTDVLSQTTQELRVASPKWRWGDFVLGVHYFDQISDYDRLVPGGVLFGKALTTNTGSVKTTSYAAFGHANISITDQLTGFGGVRYTIEKKKLRHAQIGRPFGLPDLAEFTERREDDAVSWTAGLRYEFHDNLMAYGSVSTGFKSGGFNADFIPTRAGITFDPEYVTSYEFGVKAVLGDRLAIVNASLFYLDYADLQVTQFTGLGFRLTNAATARSKGAELEMQIYPAKGLQFGLALGYTDAKFKDFKDAGGAGVDYDGFRLARAPEWTVNLSGQYTVPLGTIGSLIGRVDYSYVSEQFSSANNRPETLVPGYATVNARLGIESDNWEAFLWGKNLTNKVTPISSVILFEGNPALEQHVVSYTLGRTYGVEVALKF